VAEARGRRWAFAGLCASQASVWAVLFLSVFLGPFAIREMTGSFALSGLPFAMVFLANLVVLIPAGRAMDRIGRAPVLASGHGVGAIGAAIVAMSVGFRENTGSFAVVGFLGGLFLVGAGTSIALLTRVPVADLHPPGDRGRALGRVVLASFAGSVAGAAIFFAIESRGPVSVPLGYAAMIPAFIVGAASMILVRRRLPVVRAADVPTFQPRVLMARPGVAVTVAGNTGGWAGMVGIMSVASAALSPLGPGATGAIMLGHFGGMFLPSPLAGRFTRRRGRALAILAGGLMLATGAVLFTRQEVPWLAGFGLALVGAGWCFTFIPGTAILADACAYQERGTLFGVNDVFVAIAGGLATIFAGFVFFVWGLPGLGGFGALFGLVAGGAGVILQRTSPPGS
jgi:MFS family permease